MYYSDVISPQIYRNPYVKNEDIISQETPTSQLWLKLPIKPPPKQPQVDNGTITLFNLACKFNFYNLFFLTLFNSNIPK